MSGEFPSLRELSRDAQIANTDRELLPTVIIANTEPAVLNTVVTGIFSENYLAKAELDAANKTYYEQLANYDPMIVSTDLSNAAKSAIKAEKQHLAISEQTKLAKDIDKKQAQLARPMRVATTILCALAVGGAPAGYFYVDAVKSPQRTQKEEIVSDVQEKGAATIAVVGGAIGGFAGTFIGIGMIGREARRRARKIVARDS